MQSGAIQSLLLIVLTLLLLGRPGLAQRPSPDFSELEKVLLAEMQETQTPGAAVALVSGERVLFAKGFGVANVETGAPVTPDMLFHIGSVTKTFTAAALVSLAAEGRIKLDGPVGDYVKGLSPRLARMTLHQLLSQTSGLKDMPGADGLHEEAALADYVRSWTEDYRLLDEGQTFSYSNPGFALAGHVLAEASGRAYADQMSESLFKPLEMSRTTLRPLVAMTYPLVVGHSIAPGQQKPAIVRPLADDTRLWPAGYIFTSLNDLTRFVIALMNDGKLEGRQVLPAGVAARMMASQVEIPTNVFVKGAYGYGLFIRDYRGMKMAGHDGELPGYGTSLAMMPDERIALIILSNRDGAPLRKTFNKAFELLLGTKLAAPAVSQPQAALPMSEAEMARYVGSYTNRWEMEIFVRDRQLFLKRFGAELPITKIGDHRFSVAPPGPAQPQEFIIIPETNGRPGYIQMFIWTFKKRGPDR
jgi:CubicO group peptidase (beta-lactamase class C family)